MAASNLRIALQRRYKDWRGEKDLLDKQIEEIAAAYQTLDEKRERVARVEALITSVETIMAEVWPTWDPVEATPTRKGAWKNPLESAAVTRETFDILREAREPLRSRTIAEMVLERNKLDTGDRDLLERIRQAVDSTLRAHKAKGRVDSVDTWPLRWVVASGGTTSG